MGGVFSVCTVCVGGGIGLERTGTGTRAGDQGDGRPIKRREVVR